MTKEQFAQLVLEATDSLYRVSKGILKTDSDCEDAVWEAVSIGFAQLHTLRQEQYAKTWLIRILIHECYRILEKRKRQAGLSDEFMDQVNYRRVENANYAQGKIQERHMTVPGKYSDLYEAITNLEEKYRTPIVLFYVEGYSVREIAEILQSTEGTVKSWLSRGRNYLRKSLEEV